MAVKDGVVMDLSQERSTFRKKKCYKYLTFGTQLSNKVKFNFENFHEIKTRKVLY